MMMSDPLQLVSFVHRGCKGELVGQDWQKMNEILVELTPENLSATLEKCYDNQRNQSMFYVHVLYRFICFVVSFSLLSLLCVMR